MAEEISDEKFKSEVIRFIQVANQKFDGLAEGLRTNTFKLDHLENRLGRVEEKVERVEEKVGRLEGKVERVEEKVSRIEGDLKALASDVKVLSGQFSDVGVMAIKDNQRIDKLENRVDELETGVH
jgi:chromosome segregation ATPase